MNGYLIYNNGAYDCSLFPGAYIDFTDKTSNARQYVGYMLNRTQAMFDIRNLPDTIPPEIYTRMVQTGGYVCITEYENKLYCFFGGLGGEPDYNYMPTICTVANPALKFNKNLKIGEECIIIPNDPLYMGLLPMFNRYASLLVENDISMRIADINARLINIFSGSDTNTNESITQYLSNLEAGKISFISSKNILDENSFKVNPASMAGENQKLSGLIEFTQYLKASWLNDIGLTANYNMKREAINSTEAQIGDDSLLPFVDIMYKTQKKGWDKVNEKYGHLLEKPIEFNIGSAWKIRQEEKKIESESEENKIEDDNG